MLKINLKETGQKRSNLNLQSQKLKFSESRCCQTWSSKSFELPSNSLLQSNQQRRQLPKLNSNRNIPNTSQFLSSARRSSKSEKFDTTQAISTTHHINFETPVKSCVIRRVSQYEFIGSKQKRLNNLTPSIQVFQHSNEAAVLKKKKMNRLKMQYKFAQRSNHKKHYRHHKSRSGRLPTIPKITHKRSKTNCKQQYEGPITKLAPDLERRINLLLQRKRNSNLILRRKTCIPEQKKSIYASKDKLLKYHKIMDKKFDQFDSSCESSPAAIVNVQFNTTQFSKLHLNNTGNHQYLTPRLNHEQNQSIFTRKPSQSVITQYVIEKNKNTKNIFEQKLPQLVQPSLKELNQHFLAQKRSIDIARPIQQLIQSKVSDYMPTQIQLNSRQTQFFNQQLKIMKYDSLICHQTRIRSLPSDTTVSRNKINLQQKLWPYFQQLK